MSCIEKEYFFESAIHFNNEFILNSFSLRLSMIVETDKVREQTVAIDRVNYFIYNIIDNCIFVFDKNIDAAQKYKNANIRVCSVPEEPYDQIIGMILLLKLNAIMEGKIVITNITVGSKMSDGIKFNISIEEAANEFLGKNWWNDPTIRTSDEVTKNKIVDFSQANEWTKLDLNWGEKPKDSTPKILSKK